MEIFLIRKRLPEPEVWIEYMRTDLLRDTPERIAFAESLHNEYSENNMPEGTVVRGRKELNETVWEYLM